MRGADGPIHAILEYDPPGIAPKVLIVGGDFARIGNIAANNIASWDGTIWRPLQDGTDGPVYALITFNGNLIVAGDFDAAGLAGPASRHIAAWNGADWFSISAGLGIAGEFNGFISLLTVFNGKLIAGGSVETGSSGGYVFRLNGTTWEDVSHPETDDAPDILEVFDEDGPGPVIPLVYSDCHQTIPLSTIQRWNGTIWGDVEDYPSFGARASTVTNDGLVIVGLFAGIWVGGDDWNDDIDGIAVWDGESWSGYGSGIPVNYITGIGPRVVRQYGNDLFVAGHFSEAGGTAVQNMARWNGSQWISTGFLFSGSGYRNINEMRVHNNELFVGGDFNLTDAFGELNHLAKYNGSTWSAVKSQTTINALAAMGPYLVMGGDFGHVDGLANTYDPYYIALWNGRTIQPLSGGVDGPVRAILSFGGLSNNLIVGGDFTQVGSQGGIGGMEGGTAGDSQTAYHIALWSDAILTGGWQPMGNGLNNSVLALDRLADGTVIAGGQFTFTVINPINLNRIAKWSPSTASWSPMSTGFNSSVRALKSYPASFPNSGTIIVAGGDFTIASGSAANRIAQWTGPLDNHSSTWSAMGSGFNGTVHAIERFGGSIYAAGAFTASGTTPLNHVARWNGSAWVAVGNGLNGNVYELKAYDGILYAACEVTVGGGLTASRWNGTSWTSLAGGVIGGAGEAISLYKTELIFGGSFKTSQGDAIQSPGLARYRIQGLPWIVRQPVSQTVACHATVTFDVDLPTGYEDIIVLQWRKNGAILHNGWNGTGSYYQGATGSENLTILDASDADEGSYELTITTLCGTVTTNSASLTVSGVCPPCPMDISPQPVGDGDIDVGDLLAVIGAWGSCTDVNSCPADVAPPVNGDNVVDVPDLLAVIGAWGACP